MTECYLCGHPVLEGQREAVQREVVGVTRESTEVEDFTVHANPADHLPTLDDAVDSELAAIVKRERERAAGIVEETLKLLVGLAKFQTGAITESDVTELARRIRGTS